MLPQDELPHYLYSDYLQWKGDWELIEGIPYAMTPSPTVTHQRISQQITVELNERLKACPRCEALFAIDWIISDDTVVQPDNLVICYPPTEAFLTRPPALIFEILSPSTAKQDQTTKYRLYQEQGVRYYCLVNPETSTTQIYHLQQGRYALQAECQTERFDFDLDDCRFAFDFSRIWPPG